MLMLEFINKARAHGFTVYAGDYAGIILKDSQGQAKHYPTIYDALNSLPDTLEEVLNEHVNG